jgi:hypothetical protein
MAPRDAVGQAGTCVVSNNFSPSSRKAHTKFRINTNTLAQLNMTTGDATSAIVNGAQRLNDQANARTYQYIGGTTLLDLEGSSCNENFSIVVVNPEACSPTASACITGRCNNNQFRIAIKRTNWNSPEELSQVMSHEFAHALGLDHPLYGEGAIIQTSHEHRDEIYEYDLKCAAEVAGHRALTGIRRDHISGVLYGEQPFTGTWKVARASAGLTRSAGVWQFAAAVKRDDCVAWTRLLDTNNTRCTTIDNRIGIGPVETIWQENNNIDRIIYSTFAESPQYSKYSNRLAVVHWSSNGFENQWAWWLSYCTAMSSWMTCDGTTPIYTGAPMAVAWHNGLNRSVFAWRRQRRDWGDHKEILIAVGHVNDATLPTPQHTPIYDYSEIPPAVVCRAGQAGGYDCILAYAYGSQRELRVRRFSVTAGATRYELTFEPGPAHQLEFAWAGGKFGTGSGVAAYYHDNRFWLAFSDLRYPGQELMLWESTDGAIWTWSYANLGYSAVAPTAVSYWWVNNRLVYAR